MRPYAELPLDVRERNRAGIAGLPALLQARMHMNCRPILYVGVSGHRPDRLPKDLRRLERLIERTFVQLRAEHPDAEFVILSALAEGTDRIVARIAMKRFGARLHVPLPLPYEIYLESFEGGAGHSRAASGADFRELVGQAECYFELPLRFGTYEALAAPGAEHLRARQYALAGAWILARSHEFIAVWDGAPARGEGSTADLVQWSCSEVPEPYRYPNRFFTHRAGHGPWILPADPAADARPERATNSAAA